MVKRFPPGLLDSRLGQNKILTRYPVLLSLYLPLSIPPPSVFITPIPHQLIQPHNPTLPPSPPVQFYHIEYPATVQQSALSSYPVPRAQDQCCDGLRLLSSLGDEFIAGIVFLGSGSGDAMGRGEIGESGEVVDEEGEGGRDRNVE